MDNHNGYFSSFKDVAAKIEERQNADIRHFEEFQEKLKKCSFCGEDLRLFDNGRCMSCLNQVLPVDSEIIPKRPLLRPRNLQNPRWYAVLLVAIFTGWFGGHRFFTGKKRTGVLYLCTLGLFGFGWIIDVLRITVGCFTDIDGTILKNENPEETSTINTQEVFQSPTIAPVPPQQTVAFTPRVLSEEDKKILADLDAEIAAQDAMNNGESK